MPAKKKRHRVAVTAVTEAGVPENAGVTRSGSATGQGGTRKKPVGRKRKKAPHRRFARWRERLETIRRVVGAVPPAVRTIVVVVTVLVLFAVANLVYQVIRKPAEMFFPVSGVLKKMPTETWRQYGPFFRAYSTADISPELLAALAQVEGAGDPMAHTYWRWRLTWNLFSIYRPASSAVGMYQMTDPAFADSRRYCIRHHSVVAAGAWNDWQSCWFNDLYTRVIPSHAIELTAVSLDRNVRGILPRPLAQKASPQQKQDLAAIIHLCGAGPARAFAHRGFQLSPDERCGDHSAAAYLAQVNAMKSKFQRLAAADQESDK
ncbi:MAG TPA: hypothetical protein VN809_02925 [Telmatospirillum sp.]|nr:hypothetical protein [Telmatospirillum sp.]